LRVRALRAGMVGVRWDRNPVAGHNDALGLGEERDQHDGGENYTLQRDGNRQGAAAEAAFALALFGVAFDKATA
jgi:hypothetical protein